ncbi:MAG: DUF4160 domain-containing protein [Planctomycetota bacterium]
MPMILRMRGYRFFFVLLDRSEPPHVHVRREARVAKFWLEPAGLERAYGFTRVELNAMAKIVEAQREELLRSWYEFFGRQGAGSASAICKGARRSALG